MRRYLRLLLIFAVLVYVQSSIENNGNRRMHDFSKVKLLKINSSSELGMDSRSTPSLIEEQANRKVLGGLSNTSVTLKLKDVGTLPTPTTIGQKVTGNFYTETGDVIAFSEPAANVTDDSIFQFIIVKDNQDRNLEVQRAYLYVRLKYKTQRSNNKKSKRRGQKIRLELSSVSDDGQRKQLIASLSVRIHKTNWHKLAVPRDIVEEKLTASNPSLKLQLKCFGCGKGVKLVLVQGSSRQRMIRSALRHKNGREKLRKVSRRKMRKLNKARPFLFFHTKAKASIRSKRDVNMTCTVSNDPVEFDFIEIGWDWVISPLKFKTASCRGECTPGILRRCTETRYRPLAILYFDETESLRFTNLPNMIVTECGCAVNIRDLSQLESL